jgi:cobalt/nickel transport system permease protein
MHFRPPLLHIPDGFLSVTLSLFCWLVTVITLSVAIARTNRSLGEKQVPLMGIMAAFIFAAQMINFPVAGGTSGHVLGSVLASILLGPWPTMIVMTAVIAVQALLFQDGGLLAMGANILNMGIIPAVIGYGLYRIAFRRSRVMKLAAAGLAGWLSVIAGALSVSIQLWLSGTSQLQTVLLAMLGIHIFIGLGEALITVGALAYLFRTRPSMLSDRPDKARGGFGWIAAGLIISLAVVLLAPFASANPDGLNRVAMDLGFIEFARGGVGIFSNYQIPFFSRSTLARIAAGILGMLVVGAVIIFIGRVLKERPKEG